MNSRTIKFVATVLVVSILLTILPINRDAYADSKVTFREDGIAVTFESVSSFGDKTQVNATVNNTGKKTVKDWALEIDYQENVKVTTIWNAILNSNDGIKICHIQSALLHKLIAFLKSRGEFYLIH